jgi:hypothetical protein
MVASGNGRGTLGVDLHGRWAVRRAPQQKNEDGMVLAT